MEIRFKKGKKPVGLINFFTQYGFSLQFNGRVIRYLPYFIEEKDEYIILHPLETLPEDINNALLNLRVKVVDANSSDPIIETTEK